MITNQLKENMIQGLLFGYYMLSTKFIIIKGWLHCLTSESKRRFLVSNILFGSAWCLVIAQIQFSLINKIGRSEHLLHPPPPSPNPSKSDKDPFLSYPNPRIWAKEYEQKFQHSQGQYFVQNVTVWPLHSLSQIMREFHWNVNKNAYLMLISILK